MHPSSEAKKAVTGTLSFRESVPDAKSSNKFLRLEHYTFSEHLYYVRSIVIANCSSSDNIYYKHGSLGFLTGYTPWARQGEATCSSNTATVMMTAMVVGKVLRPAGMVPLDMNCNFVAAAVFLCNTRNILVIIVVRNG